MMRAARLLVVAVALVAVGCTAAELEEFGDMLEPTSLRESTDRVKRAAGHAAETLEEESTAREAADQAYRDMAEGDLSKAVDRGDWRSLWYYAALRQAFWGPEVNPLTEDLAKAIVRAIRAEDPRVGEALETGLDSLRSAIAMENQRSPVDPSRVSGIEKLFCFLYAQYRENFGTTVRGSLYLAWLGETNCQG